MRRRPAAARAAGAQLFEDELADLAAQIARRRLCLPHRLRRSGDARRPPADPVERIVDLALRQARAGLGGAGSAEPGRSRRRPTSLRVGDPRPLDEMLRPDVLADRGAAEEARADSHGRCEERVEAGRAGRAADVDRDAQHIHLRAEAQDDRRVARVDRGRMARRPGAAPSPGRRSSPPRASPPRRSRAPGRAFRGSADSRRRSAPAARAARACRAAR